MSTIVVNKNAITVKHSVIEGKFQAHTTKKSPLVAQWSMDENGRLICRWISESS